MTIIWKAIWLYSLWMSVLRGKWNITQLIWYRKRDVVWDRTEFTCMAYTEYTNNN